MTKRKTFEPIPAWHWGRGHSENDPQHAMERNDDGAIYKPGNLALPDLVERLGISDILQRPAERRLVVETVVKNGEILCPNLPPPLLPDEWLPSALKEASLTLLDMWEALLSEGYSLRNATREVMAMDFNGRPVFQDIGGISEPQGYLPFDEFFSHFAAPLSLAAKRPELADVARRCAPIELHEYLALNRPWLSAFMRMVDPKNNARNPFHIFKRAFIYSRFAPFLCLNLFGSVLRDARRGSEPSNNLVARKKVADLRRFMHGLSAHGAVTKWTGYHGERELERVMRPGADWQSFYDDPREIAVRSVLSDVAGKTLLDIGANQGLYSILASHLGYRVHAVDYDSGAIDRLYRLQSQNDFALPIRAARLDFLALTEPHWPRFQADVVLALGFTHHLRLVELLPWSRIAEVLAGVTGNTLITEFKPGTAARWSKGRLPDNVVDDFKLDHFLTALRSQFRSVEFLGNITSGVASARELIVCRK